MKKTIAIGQQDFLTLRENHLLYIDKTDFIKEWWENWDSVTLITRPRRFGKTLCMSMVEEFFSIRYADRADLFEGLKIWEYDDFKKLQGSYPVISLSFSNVKESTYLSTRRKICQIIANLYTQYDFIKDSPVLSEQDRSFWNKISPDMEDMEATMALHQLSLYLNRYYQKKVIILLDEYDTPMQEAYIHGFWEDLSMFTRSMFNAAFKTNPALERAIMTGVTRVSKESIFSDLNNLVVITTTSPMYETSFGFTEDEVQHILKEYGQEEKMEGIKEWYDGFTFGNTSDIYNPWSILNYLKTGKFDTYWANTSNNLLIGKLLREGSRRLKTDFETLIQGGTLKTQIDEQIVYNQLDTSEKAIWSLLLASGYLRICQVTSGKTPFGNWQEIYELALTNYEVKIMFENMIREWFSTADADYNDFINSLLSGNVDGMNFYLNQIAMATFSFFDTASQPERFYHGFILGLIIDLSERYRITSNRESGLGRYDVVMEPFNPSDPAFILEFKVRRPDREKSLEETVKNALEQIEDKHYETELVAKGILKSHIKKYGLAFEGKRVLIGQA